jgi:hypothetical protein
VKVRDLERLLAANGIAATKMDIVTRGLREAGQLPVAARGANAPHVSGLIGARVLIATAGSSKGNGAAKRLSLLKKLKSETHKPSSFLIRLSRLLKGHPDLERVQECRIGRNVSEASILFVDGAVEKFSVADSPDYRSRLRVEGVIPGDLLRQIAKVIAERASVPLSDRNGESDNDA